MSDEAEMMPGDLVGDEEDSRPELPAELNLGLLPFEDNQEPDFELGRHNIDLLAMLQEKTRGNLTPREQKDLDDSVADLRFRFVHAMQAASSK